MFSQNVFLLSVGLIGKGFDFPSERDDNMPPLRRERAGREGGERDGCGIKGRLGKNMGKNGKGMGWLYTVG